MDTEESHLIKYKLKKNYQKSQKKTKPIQPKHITQPSYFVTEEKSVPVTNNFNKIWPAITPNYFAFKKVHQR